MGNEGSVKLRAVEVTRRDSHWREATEVSEPIKETEASKPIDCCLGDGI